MKAREPPDYSPIIYKTHGATSTTIKQYNNSERSCFKSGSRLLGLAYSRVGRQLFEGPQLVVVGRYRSSLLCVCSAASFKHTKRRISSQNSTASKNGLKTNIKISQSALK